MTGVGVGVGVGRGVGVGVGVGLAPIGVGDEVGTKAKTVNCVEQAAVVPGAGVAAPNKFT